MDRVWFLTWAMYGHQLPSELQELPEETPVGEPIELDGAKAAAVLDQFHETANHRGWKLLAVSIRSACVHIVVNVPGDPDPAKVLQDFKSYGSRRLNQVFGKAPSGLWWTGNSARRKIKDATAVKATINDIISKENLLVTWVQGGNASPESNQSNT